VALPLTVLTTFISVGRGPVGIAITPDGAYAYVTNSESSSVRSVPGRIVGKRLAMPTRVCRKLGLASQRESATLMGAYVAGRV
jgi:hypothetical protein